MLSGENELKICVSYDIDGEKTKSFPTTQKLYKAKPEFISMPGWKEDITGVRNFFDLPKNAQNYVDTIEDLINTKIKYISVGPKRDQLIKR